jgi:hypothetical protein
VIVLLSRFVVFGSTDFGVCPQRPTRIAGIRGRKSAYLEMSPNDLTMDKFRWWQSCDCLPSLGSAFVGSTDFGACPQLSASTLLGPTRRQHLSEAGPDLDTNICMS